MKTLNNIFTTLMIALAFTFSSTLYADGGGNADGSYTGDTGVNQYNQPGGNCGNGPHTHAGNAICNKGGGGDQVPLDGGLSILLAGAAAFGISRLRKK
ncbi:PID-CTERM protein-sorting domain-containing protein [Algibacter aquimarinus]